MSKERGELVPSLLENESRGGDIGEAGITFQAEVILSFIPKWMAMEGFTSMIRESIGDTEAKFFVPGRGYIKEFVEVKDNQVVPTKFWEEFERFRTVDAGAAGEYQWFTLASAGLAQSLHPLVNSLRRIRDPYEFYDDSAVMDNSYRDYVRRVEGLGRSRQDGDFLYRKVLIQSDLSMNRAHGKAVFKQSLRDHLPHYQDLSDRVLEDTYVDLAAFVQSRRNQPITRKELSAVLRARIPSSLQPPIQPVRIHTAISDDEKGVDNGVLPFAWSAFFGGEARDYPPSEVWNERLLGELRATKEWILNHRETRRIILSGNRRLSASMAIGSVFSAVSGFAIEMQYRDGLWATDAHPASDTPAYALVHRASGSEVRGERLVVSIGVVLDIAEEVEGDLERHGLVDMPQLHIRGESPILSPAQANLAVRQIKGLIADALRSANARQIDIFFAGPAFLALFLGHRLNATAPVQCYERVERGRYQPTARLFVDAR